MQFFTVAMLEKYLSLERIKLTGSQLLYCRIVKTKSKEEEKRYICIHQNEGVGETKVESVLIFIRYVI